MKLNITEALKKNPICLWNDYVFKFIFARDHSLCLQFLVQSVIDDPDIHHLSVMNPELKVAKVNGKKGIQDIRSIDEHGNFYGIEMQAGRIGVAFLNRVLIYHCQFVVGQLNAGDDYLLLKQTTSIIFTTSTYDKHLHVTHVLCDDHLHHIMENEKITFHIISLPAIDAIIETKETLSDLEFLSYVLRKGNIEKEMYKKANHKQRKVLKEMEERINELTKDPTRVNDAIAAALIQATYEDDMAYYRQEGREEGRKEGKEEGLEEGRKEGKEEGLEEGRKEGKEEGLKKGRGEGIASTMTLLLMSKFGGLSEETTTLINSCSLHQLNHLVAHFYEIQCEEDIQRFLKM